MATWDTISRRAARRYGLEPGAEDALLSDRLLLDRVNELLQEVAEDAQGWREDFTLNLSASTSLHALSARVIRVIDGTVRADYDGGGQFLSELRLIDPAELRSGYGPLENDPAGVPGYYYVQRGSVLDAMINLVVYPQSDTARTGGLKFSAVVYPALIAAPADTLPLQLGEERFLLPGICYCLAQVEHSRGNQRAPLPFWQQEWAEARAQWADVIEDMQRGDIRRVHRIDTSPYDW